MMQLHLDFLGSYRQSDPVASFDKSAAEILAYHEKSKHVYATNSFNMRVDYISMENPSKPELSGFIQLTQPPTSVSVYKNILAVSLVNAVNSLLPGNVAFYDIKNSHALLVSLQAGSLPDAVFFSPNGHKVVVCNEGEPDGVWNSLNTGEDHNPKGTITVVNIDHKKVKDLVQADVTQLDFDAFDRDVLRAAGVKITGPGSEDPMTSLSQYMEPEYAAISLDSRKAYVALQENNAIAVVDLENLVVESVRALGEIDRSLDKNALDASNTKVDPVVSTPLVDIRSWHDLVGLYQPDSIAYFEDEYIGYLVTANEGDAQDYAGYSEEARVSTLPLDPVVFPDAASLQLLENLGRLKVTTELGKNVAGNYDKLYSYGGRSFSLFKVGEVNMELVYDSGAQFEKITNVALPEGFNSSNDQNKKKNRSDDKGPEPEALALFLHEERRYAAIGLERVGGVMLYDLTDLNDVRFVQYVNNRNFTFELSENAAGDPAPTLQELKLVKDLGPESILFLKDERLRGDMLVVANEVSGTVSSYSVKLEHAHRVCKSTMLNMGVVDVVLDVRCCSSHSIQWVKQDGNDFDVLVGETDQTLTLNAVDPMDTSVYFALLTNYCDDVTSCVSSQRVSLN